MNSQNKVPSKVTPVLSETRTWTSGNVKFTVLTVEGHPQNNYITLQKNLVGRRKPVGVQRFVMNLRDWTNLKHLIEVELPEKHHWVLQNSGITVIDSVKTRNCQNLSARIHS